MRITQNQMAKTLIQNIHRTANRISRAQLEVGSGVRIHLPSDDPSGTAKAMDLRRRLDEIAMHQSGMDDGVEWLKASDTAMSHLTAILHRARVLAIEGANSDKPPDAMVALEHEMRQLVDQAFSVLNSTHNGRYLFAGTAYTVPPFVKDPTGFGTPAFGYQGNAYTMERIIDREQRLTINVTGNQFSGGADPAEFLNRLEALADAMAAMDHTAIGGIHLDNIQDSLGRVLALQSDVGARVNRIQMNTERNSLSAVNTEGLLSKVQDTDIAKSLIDLSIAQASLDAALGIGARLIPATLLDFLR